ncbi:MAG: haloalkane dehalogenase [Myxococcales bacterium]|nr:haloalkane dehalogenase [Myxococcales bacterium]
MATIEALRTPEERFTDLEGYDFTPNYVEDLPGYEGLRLHYIDAGDDHAQEVFLCLHGEPSWSYLYRKMGPIFSAAGHRVVAPDFFGFGRSDKPVSDATYTFDFHRRSLLAFIERLQLTNLTLVVQDWGGILGLTLPMQLGERVSRLLLMNTGLPTGEGPPSDGFIAWRDHCRAHPDLDVGALMARSIEGLGERERAAYDAPFPDARYKAGVRRFPEIVPITPIMSGAELCKRAQGWLATHWRGPVFMAVGMKDPVLGPAVMEQLRRGIPGCPPPLEVPDGGHFVQEHGEGIARAALEAFGLD